MITLDVKHIAELLPHVSGPVKTALLALKDVDFSQWTEARYEIDGDNIFAMVNHYDTEPVSQRRPEKHFKYTDIQIVLEGSEKIGYCPFISTYNETENKKDSNDVVFYEKVENENFVTLKAGDIAIFFPWEVHRPNCQSDNNPVSVKKVVVKVKTC